MKLKVVKTKNGELVLFSDLPDITCFYEPDYSHTRYFLKLNKDEVLDLHTLEVTGYTKCSLVIPVESTLNLEV